MCKYIVTAYAGYVVRVFVLGTNVTIQIGPRSGGGYLGNVSVWLGWRGRVPSSTHQMVAATRVVCCCTSAVVCGIAPCPPPTLGRTKRLAPSLPSRLPQSLYLSPAPR